MRMIMCVCVYVGRRSRYTFKAGNNFQTESALLASKKVVAMLTTEPWEKAYSLPKVKFIP